MGPHGSLVGKDADLSAHRTGVFEIDALRYTRTWTRESGSWRVLAAHIAPAA